MPTREYGAAVYFAYKDGQARKARLDGCSHELITTTPTVNRIHEGVLFKYKEGFALNNASRNYLIRPPKSNKLCHFTFYVSGSQDTAYYFRENSGYDPGTKCYLFNADRYSKNTPETEINIAAGGAGAPTTLLSGRFGIAALSGGRGGGAGGISDSGEQLILSKEYKYCLTVTALSANVNNITVSFEWFECVPLY